VRGDLQAAQGYYGRALAIFEARSPNSVNVAKALNNLGYIALKQGRLQEAQQLFARAVDTVEGQRSTILSPESRALFVAEYSEQYTGLLNTQLALKDWPAAFAAVERARARGLVDLLGERVLDFRGGAPEELLRQQADLDEKRSAAYYALTKLDPQRDGGRVEKIRNDLATYVVRQRDLEGPATRDGRRGCWRSETRSTRGS